MNASRTDQPRTKPVALRTKTARSSNGLPAPATVAIYVKPPLASEPPKPRIGAAPLAARQYEFLDLLSTLDVDHCPEQLSLLVRASGIDAERPSKPLRPPRFVDVTVQRKRRLVAL